MNKFSKGLLSTFALVSMTVFISCQGAKGTKGDPGATGPQGEQGEQGIQGVAGADGASADSALCFTCHSETTTLGNQIEWAKAGWEESVHANGLRVPIYAQYGGTTWYVAGYEWEGSDAFYSNGGGCQTCHTKEGFRKKLAGDYNDGNGDYDVSLAEADTIENPSNLTCFACHSPHADGDFGVIVPDGTEVVTEAGATYSKAKGSLCASCHQTRLGGEVGVTERIIADVIAGIKSYASYWGPHHGPQTDMLLGAGGYEYSGETYTNSAHTSIGNANCVACHMATELDATLTDGDRYGLSPAVGGHSFTPSGIVHGSPKASAIGCVSCHSTDVAAANASADDGYRRAGDAYYTKTADTDLDIVNDLMVLLADPDNDCNGLLQSGLTQVNAAYTISWTTYPDGTTTVPRCVHAGFGGGFNILADGALSNQASLEASAPGRVAAALWNFKFVLEDKSMGVHNTRYAQQLLYDTCVDMNALASAGADCTLGGAYTRP